MSVPTLAEVQEEIVELEDRIDRTRLLRTGPPMAWGLFLVLSFLPIGPEGTALAATATRFWFTVFSSVTLTVVAANWVLAGRHLRWLRARRTRCLRELEDLRTLAPGGTDT